MSTVINYCMFIEKVQKMSIADNKKNIREKYNLTQDELGAIAGVSGGAVSTWERGTAEPRMGAIQKMSDALGISKSEIVKDDFVRQAFRRVVEAKYESSQQQLNRIPVYGTIPAGIPIAAIQDIENYEEIDSSMLRGDKQYFGLKVKGNSMYPMFMEGDTIIVRQQPDCESGQVCAVRVNGDDATLKKVIKQGGTTILQPLNPEYEPMFFVGASEEPSLEIMGTVVEIRRKL